MEPDDCERMSDAELLAALKALVVVERRGLVRVLRHLAEVDRRDLPQKTGYHSLFVFCQMELGYSEGAAYRRIHAARAARRFPVIYSMMANGRLALSVVSVLAPCLNAHNHRDLLHNAAGKSKREAEALVAALRPVALAADRIRRLGPPPTAAPQDSPVGFPSGPSLFAAAAQSSVPEEPAGLFEPPRGAGPGRTGAASPPDPNASRVHFSFTGDESLLLRLERARELLRHRHPDGRPAAIFSLALDALLDRIDPERVIQRRKRRQRSSQAAPEPKHRANPGRSRHVPAWVRREVWEREGGRCTFIGTSGRRCGARGFLEFDHIQPFALGGRSDDPANLQLRCRAHNLLTARSVFGEDSVPRRSAPA